MVKRLWAYLSEKEGRYFLIGAVTFFVGGWLVFFFLLLPAVTRHGEEYVLPSLVGRDYHKVHAALEKAGFQPVVIDSQYVPDKAPWTILLQEPPPKSRVKKGRKLYFTVASSIPPQVPLPRVEELPYEQAYRLLRETYGFQVADVVYVAGEVPDMVVEVRYEGRKVSAGEPVPKYAKLTLVVSRGLSDQKVPFVSVVGLPLEEAVAKLNSVGLSVGHIRYKPAPGVPTGYVYRQYPERVASDSLPMGMAIDLFVSGEAPNSVSE